MKTSLIISLIFYLLAGTSDQKLSEQFYGIWMKKEYNNGTYTLVKKKRIKRKSQTYHFKENGVLDERWAGSMCGSKKVFYGESDTGKWQISNDSILTITYNHTKTIYKKRYRLLNVSDKRLIIKILEPIVISKTSL